MDELIYKLVKKEEITDRDIEYSLFKICDKEHSSCNSNCPVYFYNSYICPGSKPPFHIHKGCNCFKDGKKMLKFLRKVFK